VDAFAFSLSSGIVAGTRYGIQFDANTVTDFDPNNGAIQIGVSNDASSFGTLVFSGFGNVGSWANVSGSFVAPTDGAFLTVRNDPTVEGSWVHVDRFNLEAVPEPSSLVAMGMLALGFAHRLRKRK
jgi:hypothetical protein